MAKISQFALLALAVLTGAKAQCPPFAELCGWDLLYIKQCITVEELETRSPEGANVFNSIYYTAPDGYVAGWLEDCTSTTCVTAGARNNTEAFCE